MWTMYAYGVLFLGCSGYALLRGGGPERAVALIVIFGSLISPLVAPAHPNFTRVSLLLLAVDLADQLALVIVAMRADRFWPIFAAAVHWLSPMSSLAKVAFPLIAPIIYGVTEQLSFVLVLLILAIGTWRHRSRLARFGSDASWSTSFDKPAFRRPER